MLSRARGRGERENKTGSLEREVRAGAMLSLVRGRGKRTRWVIRGCIAVRVEGVGVEHGGDGEREREKVVMLSQIPAG